VRLDIYNVERAPDPAFFRATVDLTRWIFRSAALTPAFPEPATFGASSRNTFKRWGSRMLRLLRAKNFCRIAKRNEMGIRLYRSIKWHEKPFSNTAFR
jgi:hypothetical protein